MACYIQIWGSTIWLASPVETAIFMAPSIGKWDSASP